MEKRIKKQQKQFFFQNLIAFAVLFIFLGLILFQLLRSSVYQETDERLFRMAENDEGLGLLVNPQNEFMSQERRNLARPPVDFQVQLLVRAENGKILNTNDLGNRNSDYQNLPWKADLHRSACPQHQL